MHDHLCDLCIEKQKVENASVIARHRAHTEASKKESAKEDGSKDEDDEEKTEDLETRYNAFEEG